MDFDVNKLTDKLYIWIIEKGPAFLFGIFVLIAGLWLIKVLSRWLTSRMQHKEIDPSLKPFLLSLIIIVLRIVLVLGVMQIIGIEMTIFAALIGATGVALGLALSGTLQNFASGIIILFLKPFSVGDNIIASGIEGTVSSIQIFYTVVTTFDNRTVIYPNSKLSNEVIVNISRSGSRRLDIEFKLPNAVDFEAVKQTINAAIDDSKEMLKKPERRIGISSLEPDGYKVSVSVWVKAHGFTDKKFAFQEKLIGDLKKAGLKLPGM
ncbi:MAG: mechanosensitive ion channel family protein [Chitinophagaceae bacterium]|nr:MAG: mechanosensitive ion channel family protein [Chitinophagaceae bacterium]